MKVVLKYSQLESFKYFCRKHNVIVEKEEFLENVILYIKTSYENEKLILENNEEFSFKIEDAEKLQEIYI